ncbi:hypothetical protein BCR42DRAFT_421145 [Absidia repens]|uniref:Uncharacterized protein n=1 Tax=Absidia repens TaxID=90262 RepID=A0A1X2I9M3_9FUNG|nr:hypothetical protein BCR42DRAFT_421145 [Absidia repens]
MDCNFDNGHQLNFDLLNKSTITIHHHAHDSHLYHYLQLTPKRYYILREPHHEDILRYTNMQKETLCRHFQFDDQSLKISVVRLNLFKSFSLSSNYIYLTGSFSKNKWILGFTPSFQFIDNLWLNDDNDDTATVFNIY